MFNLFRNEWRKLWAKKSSWILLLIAVVFAGLTAWGMHGLGTGINSTVTSDSLSGASTGAKAFLTIFSSGSSLVSIFAIVMTAIIITEEFAKNTIKLLLTRPYNRHQILCSKFLAALAYLVVSLVVVYLVAILFTGAFWGFGGLNKVVDHGMNTWLYGLVTIAIYVLGNLFYLSVVFVLAAGMRSQGLAITFSILLEFVLSIVTQLLTVLMVNKQWWWIKWNPFNLMSYNPLVGNLKGMPAAASLSGWGWAIGLIIYIAVFYFIADYIFNRRDVSLS
ncbi:ABC transporter permease [Schleiferilactobacillus shenzhenensis]|uniref:Uncharacterized protein n=1 Tax=Schleiferilactobacillus shenzhenensis LY-73 TaxID=1231336 RepID=U4TTZ7_9LACO|nr:ABC transporter permease subunit [Schleiferilactobacillus shenzhenensis]ERL64912.1 hypothetical protein L248_0516 [Schleiferilactobacillus shenzhenensis LY-73]